MLNGDLCADGRDPVNFIHVFILQGDTAIGPHLVGIYCLFVVRPGTVDGDAVPDLCVPGDQALCFSIVEFRNICCGWVIEVHDLVPFIVRSFRNDMIRAFRGFAVAHDHFVFQ